MKLRVLLTVAASCGMLLAQSSILDVQPKRTNDYDDNKGSGYCTVRLMVDNVVVVHIRGNLLGFETLAGSPARDDGSECSQAMPYGSALSNFQFKGIDGRGQVELVEQPSANNNYTARIRITDTRRGAEGYTFRVDWTNLNPGQTTSSTSGWDGRRQRRPGDSGWGTPSSSGSGWGTSSSSNSGWGTTATQSTAPETGGWGTGTTSTTPWGQNDFDATTAGSGVARMAGQTDLALTSARLRLRNNGRFMLEIAGTESVRFSGTWQRSGNTAVLTITNGFGSAGANGTGRAMIRNNELRRLEMNGKNANTSVAFTVEFRSSTAGSFRR